MAYDVTWPGQGHDMRRNYCHQWITAINDWSLWLRASGSARGTVRVRRWYVRRLAEDHPHRSPWKLRGDDLSGWLATQGWGGETLKNGRASLRSFYGWACSTGRVDRDPSAGLPAVHIPAALPRPVGDELFTGAVHQADDRTELMLLLARRAGLRDQEIANLALFEVADAVGTGWLIVAGKGGRDRRVPVAVDLRAALRGELQRRAAGRHGSGYRYVYGLDRWLFPGTKGGGPMRADSVGRVISRALGPQATAHQLRHAFATSAYRGTHDLRAVQALLGHRRPETTARYTALDDGAMQDAVRAAS